MVLEAIENLTLALSTRQKWKEQVKVQARRTQFRVGPAKIGSSAEGASTLGPRGVRGHAPP